MHSDAYARAKMLADARAFNGNGNGNGHGKPGGGGSGGTAPTITSYANVSPSFQGVYQTQLAPPDTTGAMGNDRFIEAINTKFNIYSRTGASIGGGSLAQLTNVTSLPKNDGCSFFASLAHSDPQIKWDVATQRFYYTDIFYDGSFLSCAGVSFGWSTTATPASASDFCHILITTGPELFDYDKLGDSKNFMIIGYNKFGNAGRSYDGSEFMTINKPPSGTTCPTTNQQVQSMFSLHFYGTGSLATPVPAQLVDDSHDLHGTGYVVANPDLTSTNNNSASTIGVFSVSWDGSTVDGNGNPVPTVSVPTTITVPTYALPPNAPEKGTTALIDTLDGRFEAAMAAVDRTAGGIAIWTAHAVKSGDSLRSEERWYEINPSGSLYGNGTAGSGTLFTWNGAISSDRNGSGSFGNSWALSVSASSSTTNPAIQFQWKKAGGTASSLQTLAQANGPNIDFTCSPCRWGDYSGASPDPGATGTVGVVWLANQTNVASSTNSDTDWRTWIFAATPS